MGLARGGKVRWALGGSAALWAIPLLLSLWVAFSPASGAPNPIGSNSQIGMLFGVFVVGGFLVIAVVLWLLFFFADALRHAASDSDRSGS